MIKELTNKIFRDTSIVMAANLINFGSAFLMAVFVSRFLGVESLGEFTFIFAFVLILSAITDFGTSTLLVRKLNEGIHNPSQLLNRINIFKSAAGIGLLLLLAITGYLFSSQLYNYTFVAGIASVIPRSIQATYESSIRSKQNQFLPSVIKSLNSLIQLVMVYFILLSGNGLFQIFLIMFLCETLTAIVFYASDKMTRSLNNTTVLKNAGLKDLLKESTTVFTNNFLTLSMPRIVIILAGYLLSQAAVGVFTAASRFVNSVGLISGALFNSYYPLISNIKNDDRLKFRLTENIISYSISAGLIVSVLLYFLSDILVGLTFRTEGSAALLRILSFTAFPVITGSVIKAFFYSHYKEQYLLKLFAIWWIVNAAGSAAAMHYYGLSGLAAAVLIIEYVFFAVLLAEFIKEKRKASRSGIASGYNNSEFHDNISGDYDNLVISNPFTVIVRKAFQKKLLDDFEKGSNLLELGCGTGIDTLFIASEGNAVTALDISAKMLEITSAKTSSAGLTGEITLINADMENLGVTLKSTEFDGVFSNFNGVNYVRNLPLFAENLQKIVRPGARIIFTMLNRFCLQEVLLNMVKLDPLRAFKSAFSRNKVLFTDLNVYFPKKFYSYFSSEFTLDRITGIGFILPPHSFFGLYRRLKFAIPLLHKIENILGTHFPFYNISDHYIIELTKK